MQERFTKVVISMGSNHQQEAHIAEAMERLRVTFFNVDFSPAKWTEPIGLPGSDRFLNMLAVGYTHVAKHRVEVALKDIERQCGRNRRGGKRDVVNLDLDLLLYGDEVCHEEDWKRDYIQCLTGQMGVEFPSEEARRRAARQVRVETRGRKKKNPNPGLD